MTQTTETTEKTQKTEGPAFGRTAIWTLVIVSAASFMAALDNLVVTTALPSIREELGGGLSTSNGRSAPTP